MMWKNIFTRKECLVDGHTRTGYLTLQAQRLLNRNYNAHTKGIPVKPHKILHQRDQFTPNLTT